MENKKNSFKQKLEILKGKNFIKILYTLSLLAGALTGVILVQKDQDIREKAQVNCSSFSTLTECDQHKPDCSWYLCQLSPNNAACAKTGTSNASVCCPKGQYYCTNDLTGACSGKKMLWACSPSGVGYAFSGCITSSECTAIGGGGSSDACDNNDSDQSCKGKKVGASCGGGVCTAESFKPNSQKWICRCSNCGNVGETCVTRPCCSGLTCNNDDVPKCEVDNGGGTPTNPPGGGGGGGGTPTNPPGGGNPTNPPGGGTACGINYHENPSAFAGFSKSGRLILYVDPGGYKFNIALKKNADTCSQSDNDVLLDTENAVNSKLDTGIDVTQGDRVCIYPVGYEGTPGGGWIEPEGNLCKGPKGTPRDISDLLNKAQEAVSVQCWGDVEVEDCDFNDFVFVFAVEEGEVANGVNLKLRFQGITQKAGNILTTFKLFKSGSVVISQENDELENDSSGLYALPLNTNLDTGTYDLIFKGNSHLQRKITGINITQANQIINLGTDEKKQAKAGDVTGDNVISLDDIARVSKYYKTLSVPVVQTDADMLASDVNKDGSITIQDLALIAINWSDFSVKGDE